VAPLIRPMFMRICSAWSSKEISPLIVMGTVTPSTRMSIPPCMRAPPDAVVFWAASATGSTVLPTLSAAFSAPHPPSMAMHPQITVSRAARRITASPS
jgi:hypothetical protein